jgi:site-specific DNA recombinase
VRVVLKNPRYLGYEVWNRQKRHEVLLDVHDVALGHHTRMRWNNENDWVHSKEQTHEPLITDDLWDRAQAAFDEKRRPTLWVPKTRPGMLSRRFARPDRIRRDAARLPQVPLSPDERADR